MEGETAHPAPVGANLEDVDPDQLLDIDFDDGTFVYLTAPVVILTRRSTDDETNMQRHARKNAQEAIAAAKRKAQDFDTQTALERKTNEAIMLAKQQAHIRGDEQVEGDGSTSGAPLVDRECLW